MDCQELHGWPLWRPAAISRPPPSARRGPEPAALAIEALCGGLRRIQIAHSGWDGSSSRGCRHYRPLLGRLSGLQDAFSLRWLRFCHLRVKASGLILNHRRTGVTPSPMPLRHLPTAESQCSGQMCCWTVIPPDRAGCVSSAITPLSSTLPIFLFCYGIDLQSHDNVCGNGHRGHSAKNQQPSNG